jgi:CDP-2,3-bis-(O-geranylgeranyl)-sn-glycerol synthase
VQTVLDLQLLTLLAVANGAPVIATRVLHARGAYPVDGGLVWTDGRRLLGPTKTVRGVVLSVAATTPAAALLGCSPAIGALIALCSMSGDLASSFVKRRLGLVPESRATGLDQIPESLLPLLVVAPALSLGIDDVAIVVILFLSGEIVLSRWLYRLHVRDRPY